MFLRVIRLRFGEIARRVCHKLCQGRHAAEAIGLALKLRVYRAVGRYVLAHCKAHRTHVAVLTGRGQSRRGYTEQAAAHNYRCNVRSQHCLLPWGFGGGDVLAPRKRDIELVAGLQYVEDTG